MGKEFPTHADYALYASSPPLEVFRLIVSRAAMMDKARHIMICDVRPADFYAEVTRDVCV